MSFLFFLTNNELFKEKKTQLRQNLLSLLNSLKNWKDRKDW